MIRQRLALPRRKKKESESIAMDSRSKEALLKRDVPAGRSGTDEKKDV